ncbi:MAG: SpoIID/LytB domain-containing protein [Anaerolineae bacterium]|nr:SpoIID/LytB domain-containing protein [Anaerolineae bacterium]
MREIPWRGWLWPLLLGAVGLLLYGAPLLSQGPLIEYSSGFMGTVTDLATGEPIVGARVSVGKRSAITDQAGRYILPLPAGVYNVRVQAPEYIGMTQTYQRVQESGWTSLSLEMIPQHPSPQEARVIDERVMHPGQEPPSEEEVRARGYGLSNVQVPPSTIRVLMPDGSVVVMPLDEYLKGVVAQEVPAYWPMEALKAQAVAARSYAATRHAHSDVGADVCTTVHCQAWSATHYDTTDQAVDETHGVVATYAGNIIHAFFFAHCNGHTRNSEDVWGGYLPYCRSVSCPCGYTYFWGHGVGMCQQGARVLAVQGQDFEAILKHYYTGIEVTRPSPGRIVYASVDPLSGDTNTWFTYQAFYESALGDLPAIASVLIDGQARALQRVPESSRNLYRLVTKLAPGEHTFRFHFDDGYGHSSAVPNVGTFVGPSVSEAEPTVPVPTLPPTPTSAQVRDFFWSTRQDWEGGTLDGLEVVAQAEGALRLTSGTVEGEYLSLPVQSPFPFMALGVCWITSPASRGSLSFDVRLSQDGDSWGEWCSLQEDEDAPGRHGWHSTNLLLGEGRFFQYRVRFRVSSEGESPVLTSLRVVCLDTRPGPTAAELAATYGGVSSSRPLVIPRSAWGAEEHLMFWPPEYRVPKVIILHHTGSADTGLDPAAVVRALYYYDAVVREWGDIGYNYLIDRFGNIYEGRSGGPGVVGRHARRFDWGSIGVALIGDYDKEDVPSATLERLEEWLAWQCRDYFISPLGEGAFIDQEGLPKIMAHRDCAANTCPGERLYALLPEIRLRTLQKMAQIPPHIELASPREGEAVRGVVHVSLEASANLERVDYFVDGVLRASVDQEPFGWRWNTLEEPEGVHVIRAVAHNAAGEAEDEVQVRVDNTLPGGEVQAPAWNSSPWVPFTIQSEEATAVQFSNDWVWEGEELYHAAGSGHVVEDPQALNGQAWMGRAGTDVPGGWYGPYTCDLPSWRDYWVYFRLKTPDRTLQAGLATLDIVDNQGQRRYALREISGPDFARSGAYEEFPLQLEYRDRWPTCSTPGRDDGLEFRTWFSGAGDLYLDRISIFSAPQALNGPAITWKIREEEGLQRVLVRLLDEAGNAQEYQLAVGLDRTPPQWVGYGFRSAWVEDALSGLDVASAQWAVSRDGGAHWEAWQNLQVEGISGTRTVQLVAPSAEGTHLRFRISDLAGNESISAPLPLEGSPTATPTASLQPTSTPTPELTLPATPTVTRTLVFLQLPLLFK